MYKRVPPHRDAPAVRSRYVRCASADYLTAIIHSSELTHEKPTTWYPLSLTGVSEGLTLVTTTRAPPACTGVGFQISNTNSPAITANNTVKIEPGFMAKL
jgi:hypothetical protein